MANARDDQLYPPTPENGVSQEELLPIYERRRPQDGGDITWKVASFASTIGNDPSAAIHAYCLSSISMTLVNKYVVSGASWNLSFLYLAIQSFIGTLVILACKKAGLIPNPGLFDLKKAQTWLPICLLLIGMIYTGMSCSTTICLASLFAYCFRARRRLVCRNLQRNFPVESRQSLYTGIVYSGVAAIFISYCTALCIRARFSTTYAMVGALNKLPLAVAGFFFFAAPVTFGGVSAIVLGFISSLVYMTAKTTRA